MSYPEQQLRARLEHVLGELKSPASLYLSALACCLLAAPEENTDAETMLESLFTAQAAAEGCDSDELLTNLCMVKS